MICENCRLQFPRSCIVEIREGRHLLRICGYCRAVVKERDALAIFGNPFPTGSPEWDCFNNTFDFIKPVDWFRRATGYDMGAVLN